MSIEEDITLQKAKLGSEAESFLSTSLGRYLMERSEMEAERLKEQLVAVAPDDTQRNIDIRNQIFIARQFSDWITEVISEGRVAQDELQEREAYE